MSRTGNRGLSLIEVLMSVVILSIGAIFILRSYLTSLRGFDIAQERTAGILLAEGKMAEIEMEGRGIEEEGNFAPSYPEYNWRLEVSKEPEIEEKPLAMLSLIVSHKHKGKQQRDIRISTYTTYQQEEEEN